MLTEKPRFLGCFPCADDDGKMSQSREHLAKCAEYLASGQALAEAVRAPGSGLRAHEK